MAVLFDTLRLAQRLEAAGMAPAQAQSTAGALAEGLTDTAATAADIETVRGEIRESELRLRGEIREVELRLGQRITEAEARLLRLMPTHTPATIAAVAAIVGLAAALTPLFH
jgi:hypothetical protein